MSSSTYITTCCLGGFQEKLSLLIQKKSPAYSVIRHDWNFKRDWLLWSDETKNELFSSKTLIMILVNTGIKSTPCVQWNIQLYFWCCGPIFLLEVLDILCRHMASWILSNTNRYKIKKWLTLNPVENEWGELKRRSKNKGSVDILDEGMVSDLSSGVL